MAWNLKISPGTATQTQMFSSTKGAIIKIKILVIAILIIALICCVYRRGSHQTYNGIIVGANIHSVSFSANDKYLAVASLRNGFDDRFHRFNGGIFIYEVATKKLYKTIQLFPRPDNPEAGVGAFYTVDGKYLVVNDANNKFTTYDSLNFEITDQRPLPSMAPDCVRWGKASSAEIISKNGKPATLIKLPDRSFTESAQYQPSFLAPDISQHALAIADISGNVEVFDWDKRRITAHISCKTKSFNENNNYDRMCSLVWLPREGLLWILNTEGRSVLWDSVHNKIISDVMVSTDIRCVTVSHKGDYVAFGTVSGRVQIVTVKHLLDSIRNGSLTRLLQ